MPIYLDFGCNSLDYRLRNLDSRLHCLHSRFRCPFPDSIVWISGVYIPDLIPYIIRCMYTELTISRAAFVIFN